MREQRPLGGPTAAGHGGGQGPAHLDPVAPPATWRDNCTIRPAWLAPVAGRVGGWLRGRDIRRRLDAFAAACADPGIVAQPGATPA